MRGSSSWRFHCVALASGATPLEAQALAELAALVEADEARAAWARGGSQRVVRRAELAREALLRARGQEEGRAEGGAPLLAGSASSASALPVAGAAHEEVTPEMLATAFQALVDRDKREFERLQEQQQAAEADAADEGGPAVESDVTQGPQPSAPARIYLLVDYPSSLEEVEQLLRLGEAGCDRALMDSHSDEQLPLLPLIDGVVLLVDPLKELRSRRKSSSMGSSSRRSSLNPTKFDSLSPLESFAAPPSPFLTANPTIASFYNASRVGGLQWSDFVFTDISCARVDPADAALSQGIIAADLVNDVMETLERLSIDKFAFKEWVQTTKVYSIPSIESNSKQCRRLQHTYEKVLQSAFSASTSVSSVVYALREAVGATVEMDVKGEGGDEEDDEEEKEEEESKSLSSCPALYHQEWIEFGDEAAMRVARASACRDALRLNGNPHALPSAHGVAIADIERIMWQLSDLPGVGNAGRKGFPVVPMLSQMERGVLETEFASFCPQELTIPHVHLTRQLLQIEEQLGAIWAGKVQSRGYGELLNERVFPQRLAQILLRSPAVFKSYYEPTDALLLAFLIPTAPGRFRTSFWSARDHVRHRPAFKDWKKERAMSAEYLTPRTAEASRACVPLSSSELDQVSEKLWVFYPADHSVVRLHQNPRGQAWLSVYQGRGVFGLRPLEDDQKLNSPHPATPHAMQFVASFEDESRLHVCEGRKQFPKKPDKFTSVNVSNSFPCGLIITACSDGSVIQKYDHDAGDEEKLDQEVYRVIYGRGCVLRVLHGNKGQVLTPEGAAYSVVIRTDGSLERCKSTQFSLVTTSGFTVDPETKAVVEHQANGVIIATHTDGARVTYHLDGTRMYMNPEESHILVQKHGFAEVCFDINVNLTAQRHASGERVAVTKGGLRTRSIVKVYDGTVIEIAYNTKVTAQVNGRVITTKPDGTRIIAKDSGRIEYSLSSTTPGASGDDDNELDVVNHNGVYYFDIRLGRFELCDQEQNVFLVETGDGSSAPRASVDLAGVVSEAETQKYGVRHIPAQATINNPIEPHVFVLNGDGTALEILQPHEVSDYIKDISSDSSGKEAPLSLPRAFLQSIVAMKPWSGIPNLPPAPLFRDQALTSRLMSLRKPTATVGKLLSSDYYAEFDRESKQSFIIVRRLWSLQPLSTAQIEQMQVAWRKWKQWQSDREANKDRFKVVDPRNADAIAQEAAMQKRVLAAYKAARARKKQERQKARELRLAAASKGTQMETVPEGNEEAGGGPGEGSPRDNAGGDEDEDDEFDQYGSESDDGTCDDPGNDVDDPMALLWTAFSQVDESASGLLSLAQTRQAIVHALGVGVTTSELSAALSKRLHHGAPLQVSFDLFVDLVDHFKLSLDCECDPEISVHQRSPEKVPRLRTPSDAAPWTAHQLSAANEAVAAGSGAEAVRRRQSGVVAGPGRS